MSAPPVPSNPRLVALLGWPVAHSVSPHMHNAAFRDQGLDLVYVALPTPPDQLRQTVEALGSVGAVGANVTVPHKEQVVPLCDELTDEATLIGAVNTLAWSADGLVGDNTDAAGLGSVIQHDLRLPETPAVVLLGTGGAARATAVAFGRVRAHLTVVGRRADAAAEIATLAETAGAASAEAVDLAQTDWVRASLEGCALAVNATPLGLHGEDLPLPFDELGPGQRALDLIYNPIETPWLRQVRARGAEPHHGLGMLVGQAAAAYRTWTGQDAPAGTMSAAAMRVLGSRSGHASSSDA